MIKKLITSPWGPVLLMALLIALFSTVLPAQGFLTTALNSLAANSYVVVHQPGGNSTGLNLTEAVGFQQFNVSSASTLTFSARQVLVLGETSGGAFTTTIPGCTAAMGGMTLELVKQASAAGNWTVNVSGTAQDFWYSAASDGWVLSNADREVMCRCGIVSGTYYWIVTSRQ